MSFESHITIPSCINLNSFKSILEKLKEQGIIVKDKVIQTWDKKLDLMTSYQYVNSEIGSVNNFIIISALEDNNIKILRHKIETNNLDHIDNNIYIEVHCKVKEITENSLKLFRYLNKDSLVFYSYSESSKSHIVTFRHFKINNVKDYNIYIQTIKNIVNDYSSLLSVKSEICIVDTNLRHDEMYL